MVTFHWITNQTDGHISYKMDIFQTDTRLIFLYSMFSSATQQNGHISYKM
jgi:hypothetical protein